MINQKKNWKRVLLSELQPPHKIISPRWGHACTKIYPDLIFFGGYAGNLFSIDSRYMNDLWSFDLINMEWRPQYIQGIPPSLRSNCTMNADIINKKAIIFGGGAANKARYNDINILNWQSKKWQPIGIPCQIQKPMPRTYHSAQLYENLLVIFGGQGVKDLNDLWVFDFGIMQWVEINQIGKRPRSRRFHASSLIDSKMYVLGGCYQKYFCLGDVYQIDLKPLVNNIHSKVSWKQIKIQDSSLLTRWGHSCSQFEGKLYIFGGRFSSDLNDLLIIDPQNCTLKQIYYKQKEVPVPRRRHCATFYGSSLIVFGGYNGEYFNDMFYYYAYNNKKLKVLPSSFYRDRMKALQIEGNIRIGKMKLHSAIVEQCVQKFGDQTLTQEMVIYIYTGKLLKPLRSIIFENPTIVLKHSLQVSMNRKQIPRRLFNELTSSSSMNGTIFKQKKVFQNFSLRYTYLGIGFNQNKAYRDNFDVFFKIKENVIGANKIILMRSQYFENLFLLNPDIDQFDQLYPREQIFYIVLNYLYFDVLISKEQPQLYLLLQIIEASDYYFVDRLKSVSFSLQICQFKVSQIICLNNIEQIYQWSLSTENKQIRKLCCRYLAHIDMEKEQSRKIQFILNDQLYFYYIQMMWFHQRQSCQAIKKREPIQDKQNSIFN